MVKKEFNIRYVDDTNGEKNAHYFWVLFNFIIAFLTMLKSLLQVITIIIVVVYDTNCYLWLNYILSKRILIKHYVVLFIRDT